MDFREFAVAAVEKEGLSRNQAAARFEVTVSAAIHWVSRHQSTGSVEPSEIGGCKPETVRGEHAEWLVARCREKD